jgi:hypothetical protein
MALFRHHLLAFVAVAALVGPLAGCERALNLPPPENIDAQRRADLGITCSADLALDGTFEEEAPRPADVSGCWPVGLWTINVTPTHSDCRSADILLDQYRFRVTRDADDNESYQLLNNPKPALVDIKVTSGGSGECEANLVHTNDWNGKSVVNLVVSQEGSVLSGEGQYERYVEDQR